MNLYPYVIKIINKNIKYKNPRSIYQRLISSRISLQALLVKVFLQSVQKCFLRALRATCCSFKRSIVANEPDKDIVADPCCRSVASSGFCAWFATLPSARADLSSYHRCSPNTLGWCRRFRNSLSPDSSGWRCFRNVQRHEKVSSTIACPSCPPRTFLRRRSDTFCVTRFTRLSLLTYAVRVQRRNSLIYNRIDAKSLSG